MKLGGTELMKRWKRMKDQYVETKRYFDTQTGTGLLNKDYEKGLDTTKKKKEHMCPKYNEIHETYGLEANVNPHAIFDTAWSNCLSISSQDQKEEDSFIDPTLEAEFHYNAKGFNLGSEDHVEDRSTDQSQPPLKAAINLPDKEGDIVSSEGSGVEPMAELGPMEEVDNYFRYSTPDLPTPKSPTPEPEPKSSNIEHDWNSENPDEGQSIQKANRTATKRKRGAEPIANRPMKPLPSVDPNPGRHKAPVSSMMNNRDAKRFEYFHRKTRREEEKRWRSDESSIQDSQSFFELG